MASIARERLFVINASIDFFWIFSMSFAISYIFFWSELDREVSDMDFDRSTIVSPAASRMFPAIL